MDSYLHDRLRADAAHTIALAECEEAVQHRGLRGRFREILIANLLSPWLPPFCKCATGVIIELKNKPRRSTQEDILVIDPTFAPPILASSQGPEGIFLFNSVLMRIEVKTTVTAEGISDFVQSSHDIVQMDFEKQPGCKGKFIKPYNLLVGFKSDLRNDDWDDEFKRLYKVMNEKRKKYPPPLSGFVSAFCVIDRGFWFLKGFGDRERSWCRLDTESKEERLVWLVAHASNTAYRAHVQRQGRNPDQGLEVGIGSSIPGNIVPLRPEDYNL